LQTCYSFVPFSGLESFNYTLSFNRPGTYSLFVVANLKAWNQVDDPGSWGISRFMRVSVGNGTKPVVDPVCARACGTQANPKPALEPNSNLPILYGASVPLLILSALAAACSENLLPVLSRKSHSHIQLTRATERDGTN